MLTLSVGLICTGMLLAGMFILNELGINVNVRKEPQYTILWMGKVTKSGKVITNGGNALYLGGGKPLRPGQRIVVAAVA